MALSNRHKVGSWGGAAVAGLALALAFPEPGWAGMAWIAPGALWLASMGQRGRQAFQVGFVGGLVFNLVALRWLLQIPFPVGAVAAWLSLSAYQSLFPAAWVWWISRLLPARAPADPSAGGWLKEVEGLLRAPWLIRLGWSLLAAAAWVALEMVQARFLSGFPWTALGVTQFRLVPLTQLAAWTGVAGVSFLMVWTSLSLAMALLRLARDPGARWGWMAETRLPLLLVVVVGAAGMMRLEPDGKADRRVRLALVQPSIPQLLIWDRDKDAERFDQIMRLTELALQSKPDVVVWPESALPGLSEEDVKAITDLVRRHQVWMILGADDAEDRRGPGGVTRDHFNAAFVLSPQGVVTGSYRKQHLVIFGEYVPLSRWLPFLRFLTPIEGGFTPGTGPAVFTLDPPGVALSPLICFEDVFAGQTRGHASQGVDLLLNLTNNGWFGRGSAQWQHAANAVFRAIENGTPLVRCTNDGLTCWIDRFGRLRQWLGENGEDIHAPGFLQVAVPVKGLRAATFYNRHGDAFGWGCVVAALLGLAGAGWRRTPSSPVQEAE